VYITGALEGISYSVFTEKLSYSQTAFYNITCKYCGTEFRLYGNRKYCCHDCYIKDGDGAGN